MEVEKEKQSETGEREFEIWRGCVREREIERKKERKKERERERERVRK